MTRLSVNINKVATLRNARGGDVPKIVKTLVLMALRCIPVLTRGISAVRMYMICGRCCGQSSISRVILHPNLWIWS